jgi:AcrR family transcriptional regulator
MQSGIAAPEREALCHSLTRVVSEHGWAGATPDRVAREAGIAPPEFYDSFRSLEECYLAVYDRMLERVTRTASRSLAARTLAPDSDIGPGAWREQLDALFGGVLLFFSVEPALARTCVAEVMHAGPAARARRDDALGRFAGYVEGLRLSHGEPMPPVAAELIVLGTAEAVHARVVRGEAEQLPQLLPELRRLWATTVAEHTGEAGEAGRIPTAA